MFFTMSKLVWIVLQPTNLIGLLVVAGAALLWTRRRRLGRWMVAIGGLAYACSLNLATGQYLIAPLENRFHADIEKLQDIDGVIVLGGPIDGPLSQSRGQVALFDGSERYFEFVRLMQHYPNARGVVSGGSPSLRQRAPGQAHYARTLLQNVGLDTNRVVFEKHARNTYENADFSKHIVKPKPGSTWLLITSAYHMPRAMGVFETGGWTVVPYPVDFRSERDGIKRAFNPAGGEALGLVDIAVKEWVGLLAYYLTGKIDTLFPAPEPNLAGTRAAETPPISTEQ